MLDWFDLVGRQACCYHRLSSSIFSRKYDKQKEYMHFFMSIHFFLSTRVMRVHFFISTMVMSIHLFISTKVPCYLKQALLHEHPFFHKRNGHEHSSFHKCKGALLLKRHMLHGHSIFASTEVFLCIIT